MENITRETILAIVGAIFASTGFWTLINNWIARRQEKKSKSTELLLGLAHDRIYELSLTYIKRGSISSDEYDNLIKYLWEPYDKLGGNGTGKRLVDEVKKLPIIEPGKEA